MREVPSEAAARPAEVAAPPAEAAPPPAPELAAAPAAQEERPPAAPPAPMSPWPFRLLWAGNVFVQAGYWMQQVGVGWLMLELTGSSTQLGIVSFLRGLPMLVGSPFAGVLVDRLDRRGLLVGSQATMALAAAAIAPLVALGWVQPWHVYALALISGAAVTLNFPARQTIIPATVPPGQVGRAVAQIAAGQNGSRMMAPGIAGALIGFSGTAACFWALAVTFFAAFAFNWQLPATPSRRGDGGGMFGTMVAGFTHIRESPALVGLMLLAAVPTVLALPYQALLPVFAREVYDVGPGGLGLLMTMVAVGAFAGALAATALTSLPCRGLILLLSGMAVGLGLVLLGLASSYPMGLAMLFLTGAAFSVYNATNNTLIHEATTDAFRGRVMSIYLMTWSLMPLGTLPAGALADHVGAPLTVALGGGLCALVVGLVWLALPALRALR